jgi:adenylate cyclase class IV
MEIEVKIRLPSAAEHARVNQLLGDAFKTQEQVNAFFDTADNQLAPHRVVFRLRTNNASEYVITVKESGKLVDGVSRASEREVVIPGELGKSISTDANQLVVAAKSIPLVKEILDRFPSPEWKRIGQYKTLRRKFNWEGFVVELDQTEFEFGTAYEIEIETVEAEQAKAKM